MRYFDSNGIASSLETQVTTTTTTKHGSVAELSNGDFVIVYSQVIGAGSSYCLAKIYTSTLTVRVAEFNLHTPISGYQMNPYVLPIDIGFVVVYWDSNKMNVAQKYTFSGLPFAGLIDLPGPTSRTENRRIVKLTDGRLVFGSWAQNYFSSTSNSDVAFIMTTLPTCMKFSLTGFVNQTFTDIIIPGYLHDIKHPVSSLQIKITGLPAAGIFLHNGSQVTLNSIYPTSNFSYQSGMTATTFSYSVITSDGEESAPCTVTFTHDTSSCSSTCNLCFGVGTLINNKCASCKANYYFKQGDAYPNCYNGADVHVGYFVDVSHNRLSFCMTNCDVCSDITSCTKCTSGFYWDPSTDSCVSTCPTRYWTDNTNRQCVSCVSNCDVCSNSTSCTTCSSGFFKHGSTATCYSTCPDPYWENSSTKTCDPCISNCAICSDGTSCDTCNNGFYLNGVPAECVDTCPVTFYPDSSTGRCESCISDCDSCVNNSECTTCTNGFYLEEDTKQCVSSCKPAYFLDPSATACNLCNVNCATCTVNSSNCTTCKLLSGYYPLEDNTTSCVLTCPSTYWRDESVKKCRRCEFPCLQCSGFGNLCSSCENGHFLFEAEEVCLTECPDGYYEDLPTKKCKVCNFPCATCLNESQCQTCSSGYIKEEETQSCVTKCRGGYYHNLSANTCSKCDYNCKTCSDKTFCTSCECGMTLISNFGQCTEVCPSDHYKDSRSICNPCDGNCKTCSGSATTCTSCNVDYFYYLNDPLKKYCYYTCPDGFYNNSEYFTCSPCHERCLTCDGPLKSNCLTCPPLYPIMKSTGCTDSCGDDEIFISDQNKCLVVMDCIYSVDLDAPLQFSIEHNNFEINVKIIIDKKCASYGNLIDSRIKIKWENIYEGSLFNRDRKLVYEIDKLENGFKTFKVDLVYNDVTLILISKTTLFRKNRLVPMVKNENDLNFIWGFQIVLDAELSFDEGKIEDAIISNIQDDDLKFKWICPSEIMSNCAGQTGRVFTLEPSDYTELQSQVKENKYTGEIKLELSKDTRIFSKIYFFTVINKTSTSSEGSKGGSLSDILLIYPLSRGVKNEDFVFGIKFLDPALNFEDFNYFWTFNNEENNLKYVNGRHERDLKIKKEDVKKGENEIRLEFAMKSTPNIKNKKNLIFKYSQPPYGGNCFVTPTMGFTPFTEFNFQANGWRTDRTPLTYKFYMETLNGDILTLSEDFTPSNTFSSQIIPPGDKFYVDIMDSEGIVSTERCLADIKISKENNFDFQELFLKTKNQIQKLLLAQISSYYNINISNELIEEQLDIIDNLLNNDKSQSVAVRKNSELFLSQLKLITNKEELSDKAGNKVDNILTALVKEGQHLIRDDNKIRDLFGVFDRVVKTWKDENKFDKVKTWIETISTNMAVNMVDNEKKIVKTEVLTNFVMKLSTTREEDVRLGDEGDVDDGLNNKDDDSIFNLPTERTGEKNTAAINVLLNKENSFLPIKEPYFSSNSLVYNALGKDSEGKLRKLDDEDVGIDVTYTVRLKVPGLNSTDMLSSSACIQYDTSGYSANSTSCQTWYDYSYLEVVCICTEKGLVVGVFDETLANFNKMNQFQFGVGELSHIKDKKDEHLINQMNSPDYDILQHYIVTYSQEKFHNNYSFWNFYFYIIKVTHPILSIFTIKSAYNRKLRLFDFFLKIYLTFFLSLIPFVMFDNKVLEDNMTKRNIQNISKKLDDISFDISQIVASVSYSVVSSIISFVICALVNAILFSEVIGVEADIRNKSIKKLTRIYLLKSKSPYFYKLMKVSEKLKSISAIINEMNAKRKSKEEKRNNIEMSIYPSEGRISSRSISMSRSPLNLDYEKNISNFEFERIKLSIDVTKSKTYDESNDISQNKYIFSQNSFSNDNVNSFGNKNYRKLSINKTESIFLNGHNKIKSNRRIKNCYLTYKERKFVLPLNNDEKNNQNHINCFSVNICIFGDNKIVSAKTSYIVKGHLKFTLVLALFIFMWVYMLVFIQRIQQKYGKNLFKICVMPLISLFFIKLLVTVNIMLLISAFLMYKYGPHFYRIKKFSFLKIIFDALVPVTSANHHQSILAFRNLIKKYHY